MRNRKNKSYLYLAMLLIALMSAMRKSEAPIESGEALVYLAISSPLVFLLASCYAIAIPKAISRSDETIESHLVSRPHVYYGLISSILWIVVIVHLVFDLSRFSGVTRSSVVGLGCAIGFGFATLVTKRIKTGRV